MVCSFVEARVRTSVDKPAKGRASWNSLSCICFALRKEEAARCIEICPTADCQPSTGAIVARFLTLIEAPKEALSWLNARQINSVVQLELARATIAVLLGVLDGEKFRLSKIKSIHLLH